MRRSASLLLLAGSAAFAVAVPAQAFAAAASTAPSTAAGTTAAAPAAGPQSGAGGNSVVVFSSELQKLDIYQPAPGCQKLPITAHVLDNLTGAPITVYADPWCMVPFALPTGGKLGAVASGYGTHVTGAGSFSF